MAEHQYSKRLHDEESDSDISQQSCSYYLPESFTKEDINLITQVSCIYSSKVNKRKKEDAGEEIKLAWEAIGKCLNTNVSDCQHRWIVLRQRFCKERIKRDSSENPTATGKFSFYDYMKWLDPYVPRRRKKTCKPPAKDTSTNTTKKSCSDASSQDRNKRTITPERVYDPELSIDPPDAWMDIGNEEEVDAPDNTFTNKILSSSTSTSSLRDANSSQCIQMRITLSSMPTLNDINDIAGCSTAKENEKPYSLFDDEDDFASDSVSSFTSSSLNNSKNEISDAMKFSSQLKSYEIQREALSNLSYTANRVINATPVTIERSANQK